MRPARIKIKATS